MYFRVLSLFLAISEIVLIGLTYHAKFLCSSEALQALSTHMMNSAVVILERLCSQRSTHKDRMLYLSGRSPPFLPGNLSNGNVAYWQHLDERHCVF